MRTLAGGGAVLLMAGVLAAVSLTRLGRTADRLNTLEGRLAALENARGAESLRPAEDAAMARLRADVAALQTRAAGLVLAPHPAGATSPEELRRLVARGMDDLETERRRVIVNSAVEALRSSFGHNVENLKAALSLTPSQVEKWDTVLDGQAGKARGLLESGGAGSDYDRSCRELVEETNARLGEVLDEAQKAAYRKLGVDWFGGALHSGRKGEGH